MVLECFLLSMRCFIEPIVIFFQVVCHVATNATSGVTYLHPSALCQGRGVAELYQRGREQQVRSKVCHAK